MLEATLSKASLLKRLIDSIISLVQEVNFDCTPSGIALQAMDSAYVSLVTILLRSDGFTHYRCDRSMSLGVNLESLQKVLKVAGNDDTVTLKAEDNGDTLTLIFENKNKYSDFELKLLAIESEKLGIDELKYQACVKMPSQEFQKIIQSIHPLGDTVVIGVSKEGIRFSMDGDLGSGNTLIKPSADVDDEIATTIQCEKEISLSFAVRYLNFFTKATNLSSTVTLSLSLDIPLGVEYEIEDSDKNSLGYIRFHLAPKIEDN